MNDPNSTLHAGAAMHVHSSVRLGRDELSRWSDGHHAESLTRPGWLSLRRFERLRALEGALAAPYDFDILTAIDLGAVADAALILDHSYTPSTMPSTVEGVVAKRLVLETEGGGWGGDAGFGAFMVQLTTMSTSADVPATPVEPPALGVHRWRSAESDITTFELTTGTTCVVEQFEVEDPETIEQVIATITAAPAPFATTRWIAAYRQVFPAQGAYFGEATKADPR